MPKRAKRGIIETKLSKGKLRKLNALRKSLGNDIANRAFAEWMSSHGDGADQASDRNARTITEALHPLIKSGRLSVPRGGYLIRRGRGRVIVERPE
ncbi:MAG TPA: hypothetical protein VED46_15080 [Alphaproteobacteria bacterium]|nr:hypothetical protein [Alphaproteobacteria bacterium]